MKHKRTAAMLLAAVLLLTLCACGKGAAPDVTPAPEPSAESAETLVYSEPYVVSLSFAYPFDGGWRLNRMARIDNRLLLGASQNGNFRLALTDFTLSEDGEPSFSTLRDLSVPDLTGRGMPFISCVTAGEDGCFYAVSSELPKTYFSADEGFCTNDAYSGEHVICRYSSSGELLGTVELHGWDKGAINAMAVSSEGKIILYSVDFVELYSNAEQKRCISLLSPDGSIAASQVFDDSVRSLKAVGSSFYAVLNSAMLFAGKFVSIDASTAELSELSFSGVTASFAPLNIICADAGGEWIVMSDMDFFGIDPAAGTAEKLFSINELTTGDISFDAIAHLGEGLYAAVGNDEGLMLLRRSAIDYSGRQLVKVAICDAEYQAMPLIRAINAADNEYYYLVATPTKKQLKMQLVSGEAPDLLLFSSSYEDTASDRINLESNVFDDLYPYLDADTELDRMSFLPNFLDGLTTNGELHSLYNSCMIYSLSALERYVGDGKNLSLDDYRRIVKENSELQAMFPSWMTKSNLLGWLCSTCLNDFTDYSSGSCDFDNERFKALLEWCNEMLPDYEGEALPESYPSYSEDEALLHLKMYQNRLSLENTYYPVCVGFPGSAGNGGYYYCSNSLGMAIPAAGENKDGAWNFVRSQLRLDAQLRLDDYDGLPVNMEAMQRSIDAIAVSDPAQAARITELLTGISAVVSGGDAALRETILDCAKAYFNGDRGLDETAALIQDRMSLYMAERYGW